MKKNKGLKDLFVVIGLATASLMGVDAAKRLSKRRTDKRVIDEDLNSICALNSIVALNKLDKSCFKYVSDSGYTSIYTYNHLLNPEFLNMPSQYVLLKVNAGKKGCGSYAVAELDKKNEIATSYHVFFYLVDEREWNGMDSGNYDESFMEDFAEQVDEGSIKDE